MEINQQKKSLFNRFLDKIEAVGNKLPEVFMIFAMLCLFMMVLSMVLSLLNVSAVHPVTKDTLVVQNLISAAGITKLLTGIVTNFSGFAPLGVVLVCMLGVGLCEKSGLLKVALRHGLGSVKGSDLKIIVILVILSIMASAAGDSGFIVMPPLGALIFISIGRNPLAGMMVAYASVAAAYGGNIIPATIDVLLVGFTETAVKISGIPTPVNPLMNYYFQVSSVVLIVTIITFVTIKIVEPRLGKLENFVAEEIEEITPLQKKGLKWAGIAVLIFIALIVLGTAPANGMLRDPETHKIISTKAPLMAGLVVIITLMFYIPGMVYGRITKTIPNAKAMVEAMNKSMSEMGGYIALTFIMAQFTALFNWSNVGIILAIKGANALNSSGFPIPVVIVLLVLFIIPLDIFLGSASAKWAVLAPILVPMFMFLGYHPAFTQMVYRIGDAVINICSPLVAYYVMLLALGRKYDKNLGLGTMIATMLPYSIFLLVIWIIQLLVWYFLKLPLGPGGPMMLS